MPRILVQRSARRAAALRPPYTPERLDLAAAGGTAPTELTRAYERWRVLHGTSGDPPSTFEKIVACADYAAQLCLHPFRHAMRTPASDPRAATNAAQAEYMFALAAENRVWNAGAGRWDMASGKTVLADATPLECTWQHLALGCLANVVGVQWMLVDIVGHTAFCYYDPSWMRWVYVESTFNEHYRWASASTSDYVPLSPLELHAASLRGAMAEIVAVQHPYQPQRTPPGGAYYLPTYKVANPNGWSPMAVTMDGRSVRRRSGGAEVVRVLPSGTGSTYFASQVAGGWVVVARPEEAFPPQGECYLEGLETAAEGVVSVVLSTDLAGDGVVFERSTTSGASWVVCDRRDTYAVAAGDELRYRARVGTRASGQVILYRDLD